MILRYISNRGISFPKFYTRGQLRLNLGEKHNLSESWMIMQCVHTWIVNNSLNPQCWAYGLLSKTQGWTLVRYLWSQEKACARTKTSQVLLYLSLFY